MTIRKSRLSASHRGETGIGSMIILMSLLLVSGSAASLIVDTNNDYTQQAQDTAQEAMAQVATGLEVVDLVGHYRDGNIYSLDILVRLGHGSVPINLEHVIIIVETSTNSLDYTMNSTSVETRFAAKQVCMASGLPLWTDDNPPIIGQGDLVKMTLTCPPVPIGQAASIKMIPAEGHATLETFTVPDNIVGTIVSLH
jgi:archaellin